MKIPAAQLRMCHPSTTGFCGFILPCMTFTIRIAFAIILRLRSLPSASALTLEILINISPGIFRYGRM